MHMFVGHLALTTTEQDRRQRFEPSGTVETIRIMTDRKTGRSCGCGFVAMPDGQAAHSAIDALNGTSPGWPRPHGQRSAAARTAPGATPAALVSQRRPSRRTACTGTDHRSGYDGRSLRPAPPRAVLLSRRLRELVCGLDRPTVGSLVVDDDRGARVELVSDLPDFGREGDLVETVVGPLARDERFDDAVQRFRTQHTVRNNHHRDASLLWTGPPSERSGWYRHGSRQWMDTRHARRGPHAFPPGQASYLHRIPCVERSAASPACHP